MADRESSKLWFIQRDFDNSTNDISTPRQPSLRPFPEVCAADRESAVVDCAISAWSVGDAVGLFDILFAYHKQVIVPSATESLDMK